MNENYCHSLVDNMFPDVIHGPALDDGNTAAIWWTTKFPDNTLHSLALDECEHSHSLVDNIFPDMLHGPALDECTATLWWTTCSLVGALPLSGGPLMCSMALHQMMGALPLSGGQQVP